jgi:hypothetical protein
MGEIYRRLGLSVSYVQQGMTPGQRRSAYGCDITYATANEIGFDFLRDQLALRLDEQVHRPFAAAVIDEVDSILIDEARIPLVIAGGGNDESALAFLADQLVSSLHGKHESRRIDDQLRGRAGRQGDPGCSRFFLSLEDDLTTKYGDLNPRYSKDPDNLQEIGGGAESGSADFCRSTKYPSKDSGIASKHIDKRSWQALSLALQSLSGSSLCGPLTNFGRTISGGWRISARASNGFHWVHETPIMNI